MLRKTSFLFFVAFYLFFSVFFLSYYSFLYSSLSSFFLFSSFASISLLLSLFSLFSLFFCSTGEKQSGLRYVKAKKDWLRRVSRSFIMKEVGAVRNITVNSTRNLRFGARVMFRSKGKSKIYNRIEYKSRGHQRISLVLLEGNRENKKG